MEPVKLVPEEPHIWSRRDALRLLGLGAAGLLTAGCSADRDGFAEPGDATSQPGDNIASGRVQADTPTSESAIASDADIQIDFGAATQPIDSLSFGSTITTYNGDGSGSSITRSDEWASRLKQLGLPAYRLPLSYDTDAGKIFSSAAHAQTEPGEEYVRLVVQGLEANVIPVIGGRQTDNDFTPQEVRGVLEAVERLQGYPVSTVILGNEPTGRGEMGLYMSRLSAWIVAAKEVNPDISVSIASMPDMKQGGADLGKIVAAADGRHDRIGVHAYQGESAGLDNTYEYYKVLGHLRDAYGKPVDVEEFNWAPRAGSKAFFGPENAVFTASVIGHVLAAGGRVYNYGDSNGALGLMNDGSGKDSQPGELGQPFPSYHGLGMLTGYHGQFRGLATSLVAATSSISGIEVIASQNRKIVLINKTAGAVSVRVSMGGVASAGTLKAWQTDRSSPLEMPQQLTAGAAYQNNRFTIDLPPTTVSSVEI